MEPEREETLRLHQSWTPWIQSVVKLAPAGIKGRIKEGTRFGGSKKAGKKRLE